MSVIAILVHVEFSRFSIKDKSETLSSNYVCRNRDPTKVEIFTPFCNTLQGIVVTNFDEKIQKINIVLYLFLL